jgi:hypothetical protein
MARLDSKLEAEGAEFLVLGALLIEGIVAHKTYTNMRGYDLIASDAGNHTSCRIQFKSRWATDYDGGFLIKNLDDCDFVVFVALNRGYRYRMKRAAKGAGKIAPKFFVFPTSVLRSAPRSRGWGKLFLRNIPNVESYVDGWKLISDTLRKRKRRP